ncbi:MAG: hypothetical protein NTW87_16390, partial [Planctomycetota bacterium]|nr:hypothetical protein [Planctomycetota bacterium]
AAPAAAPALPAKESSAPQAPAPVAKPPQAVMKPRLPELPNPIGEPPPSYRLKPLFETQVRSTDSGGSMLTVEGLLERRLPSPVAGVEYALVMDGRTLHFLTARAGVSLESFVGRRVTVTGTPSRGTASDTALLEVGAISVNE